MLVAVGWEDRKSNQSGGETRKPAKIELEPSECRPVGLASQAKFQRKSIDN